MAPPITLCALHDFTRDIQDTRNLCGEWNLLQDFSGPCVKCTKNPPGTVSLVRQAQKSDGAHWQCSKCKRSISIRNKSWFSGSHLSLSDILKITWMWVHKVPAATICVEVGVAEHTAADWASFCREVCGLFLRNKSEKIGGPGKIVEIDESKFGKRKYHRGRPVDGQWVFGGIERGSKRSFFAVVEKRDADTLIPIIEAYVEPGSTIITDCWKAYSTLGERGYIHQVVNHSKEFVSEEGFHTNTIESTWHALKRSLPKYGARKGMYNAYFEEYIVRKLYLRDSDDPFLAFLEIISTIYTGSTDPCDHNYSRKTIEVDEGSDDEA
jgi:transposase-like protein